MFDAVALSPGILHDPVLFSIFGLIVSDDQQGVETENSEFAIVGRGVVDASLVRLHRWRYTDSDVHRPVGEEPVDDGVFSGVQPIRNIDLCSLVSNQRASVLSVGHVRIGVFGHQPLLMDESESFIHISSVASVVFQVAIEEFLFTEASQIFVGDGVIGFHCGYGGKGPAGSTSILILDWSDNSLLSPIESWWDVESSFFEFFFDFLDESSVFPEISEVVCWKKKLKISF